MPPSTSGAAEITALAPPAAPRRALIFPLLLGLIGCIVLCWLGAWQLERLAWKTAVLAQIDARLAAAPGALPPPGTDSRALKYEPVALAGTTGRELHMLSGRAGMGAGYEVITDFTTTDGRRVLLDRGFVPEAAKNAPRPAAALEVTGNLHWPEEATRSTPAPDLGRNIWFARDVPAMAQALGTEPILVVARSVSPAATGAPLPVPVSTDGIPNDHLGYAITWFSLAIVWAGMTSALLWRIRHRTI